MIYVVSDIHGRYKMFKEMLEKINFSAQDHLYILGDVVDRGEEPIKALLHIMREDNMTLLLGNHEEFMLDYFKNDCRDNGWLFNGGNVTLDKLMKLSEYRRNEVLEYVKRCEILETIRINDTTFRLVHAGLQYDQHGDMYNPIMREYVLWARKEFIQDTFVKSDVVIFGHTPTNYMNSDDSYSVWYGTNKIGIDGGAVFGGQLNCLRLDDMKIFVVK